MHAAWDLAQGKVFGIPVSGHAKDFSLWAFGPGSGASDLLTGGAYGVEASIFATVLIALRLWPAYRYHRRSEAARAGTPVPTPRYTHSTPATAESDAAAT